MKKKRSKITKDELRKIAAGARRAVDMEMGVGINTHYTISTDKKKKENKNRCRNLMLDDH